ncbi:hypothetical protein KY332_03675 [Candidatus Woesearchaeota archaeon]|nr:hypothetical protein [Candidatus Woesearchaeota archaeon]
MELEEVLEGLFWDINVMRDCGQIFFNYSQECKEIIEKYGEDKLHPLIVDCPKSAFDAINDRYFPSHHRIADIRKSDEDVNTKLKVIYDEMCGEIRNSMGVVVNFIRYYRAKYDSLLDDLKEGLETAEKAVKDFNQANAKINNLFGKLPEEKLK